MTSTLTHTALVSDTSVLRVQDLSVRIASEDGTREAVSQLGIAIERGQTFALVGESGCGKSMTALALLRLLPDAAQLTSGSVWLGATDLSRLPESRMRTVRGGRMAIIFQEPSTSLNPVLTVGQQIVESLKAHTDYRGAAARARAIEWMDRVGIPDPAARFNDYPWPQNLAC